MANTLEKLRTSITGKVLVIGLLVLVLLIPMNMVESVIAERIDVYRTAEEDITGSWGKAVTLIDPILTIEKGDQFSYSNHGYTYENRYIHLSPEKVFINGQINIEVRQKGIFRVPVYTGIFNIKGYFSLPRDENNDADNKKEAKIQILLNTRSIKKLPELTWNGEKIPMTAEKISGSDESVVFYARLPNVTNNDGNQYPFELALQLTGSNALTFHSRAQLSNIRLMSNWNSPGFFGSILPTSRNIKDTGFSAEWNASNYFTDLGHEDKEMIALNWFPSNTNYGVKFVQTVDTYQLVTRATKYAILFMTLVFSVYLLYEILGNVNLHPIQYLFIGFSNCIFYLLLLSLAEHIEFIIAYIISATSSALLIALYSMCILKSRVHGILIFVMLSVLYTFLFITLKSEDYALLIGSIGLFSILSLIMYFTRNFNWHSMTNTKT